MARDYYKDYTIIVKQIDRDWSEDAVEYSVVGTTIRDECEGEENAIKYAKEEIDKL
jgi:hypothetical protein